MKVIITTRYNSLRFNGTKVYPTLINEDGTPVNPCTVPDERGKELIEAGVAVEYVEDEESITSTDETNNVSEDEGSDDEGTTTDDVNDESSSNEDGTISTEEPKKNTKKTTKK